MVNRDFQLRYTRAAAFVGLISSLWTGTLILYPLFVFKILQIPKFLPLPILLAIIVAVVVNIAFITFMAVLLTHRVAGPMYSLIKYMRQVERGNFSAKLKVREGDELKYVVRNFNLMVESLADYAHQDLVLVKGLISCLEDAKKSQNSELLEEAIVIADSLKANYDRRLASQEASGPIN